MCVRKNIVMGRGDLFEEKKWCMIDLHMEKKQPIISWMRFR